MILGKSVIKIKHFFMISLQKFKGLEGNVFLFNNGQDTVAYVKLLNTGILFEQVIGFWS
jgi:hypothetical protein